MSATDFREQLAARFEELAAGYEQRSVQYVGTDQRYYLCKGAAAAMREAAHTVRKLVIDMTPALSLKIDKIVDELKNAGLKEI